MLLHPRPIPSHLSKHGHGVKEDLDLLELQLVVHNGDRDAFDVDGSAVALDCDLFSLAGKFEQFLISSFGSQIQQEKGWK